MGVGEYVDGAAVVDIEADMAVSLIMAQSLRVNRQRTGLICDPDSPLQLLSDKLDECQD
jgi:hypothetical protein